MDIDVKLRFAKGYIADPYWPAMERVINIQKESGMNRVRSEERRGQALSQYLVGKGMSREQYDNLIVLSNRPFYTWADVLSAGAMNGQNPEEIVVPAHQMYGALAEGSRWAAKATRLSSPEQVRTILQVSDFATGKTAPDGEWERFVVVKGGAGNTLSNQRSLRVDPYIEQVTAAGRLHFSGQLEEAPDRVLNFLRYVGSEIGVGAARKMGWGRFTIEEWTQA